MDRLAVGRIRDWIVEEMVMKQAMIESAIGLGGLSRTLGLFVSSGDPTHQPKQSDKQTMGVVEHDNAGSR